MFVVQTRIPIDPAEREAAIESARRVAEASREEPGVRSYHATMDVADPPVLQFVEHFDDVDALESHTETAHYARFNDELATYVHGEMETVQFEVADSWTRTFDLDDLQANGD